MTAHDLSNALLEGSWRSRAQDWFIRKVTGKPNPFRVQNLAHGSKAVDNHEEIANAMLAAVGDKWRWYELRNELQGILKDDPNYEPESLANKSWNRLKPQFVPDDLAQDDYSRIHRLFMEKFLRELL